MTTPLAGETAPPLPPAAENSGASGEHQQHNQEEYIERDSEDGHASEEEEDQEEPDQRSSKGRRPPTASPSSNGRRPAPFQTAHALKFGLEVVARDTSSRGVTAVLCLFCKHFGREPKVGAKRRATTNFKYFKGVFRTDQYLQHHRLQHPVKWSEYEAASVREKLTFFPRYLMAKDSALAEIIPTNTGSNKGSTKKPRQSPMAIAGAQEGHAPAGISVERSSTTTVPKTVDPTKETTAVGFEVSTGIVALLVGEKRWELQSLPALENRQRSTDGAGLMFAPRMENVTDASMDVYRGAVADREVFNMAVDLCGSGLTPAQASRAMEVMAKYVPNCAALASVWDDLVENCAQVATLGSFTMLAELLSTRWAFSVSLHSIDGASSSDVEVRVRLFHMTMQDFHLCSLPADGAAVKLTRVLDTLCPTWRQSLLGVSVAGDVFDSTHLPLLVELLSNGSIVGDKLWVTWNGEALVRSALLQFFQQLQRGSFASTFHGLRTYIKSQSQLIQEIGHEAQPHGGKRHQERSIDDIAATARWFTEKRIRIRKYFEEFSELWGDRPSEAWWLCLAIFDWIATPSDQAMKTIRIRLGGLVPTEQVELLRELERDVASAFRVSHSPMDNASTEANCILYRSAQGSCAGTKTGLLEFIVELGSFVNSLLASLVHEELDETLETLGASIATFVETLTTGLEHAKLYLKSDPSTPDDALSSRAERPPPPTLPHEFAKLNGKELSSLLTENRPIMSSWFSDEHLDSMEQEHQALKRSMREKEFRSLPSDEIVDRVEQFDAAWAKTTGRFRKLHAFAGGLASVLPRERARRADIQPHGPALPRSIVATDTTLDMDVEKPLHAMQFHQLHALCHASHGCLV